MPSTCPLHAFVAHCIHRGRQWHHALALLESAKEEGVCLNVKLMSGVIAACARGGQGTIAKRLLDDMPGLGLTPDLLCYTNVIR